MKRISVREFGGPEVLKIEEADDPRPESGQVVVRIRAAGVNPADTYMRSGAYGSRNPALPFTPGSDGAGIVHAVGPDVSGLKVGDRVYTCGTLSGSYAEMALCQRSQLQKLPDKVTFPEGAAIFVPYVTAYRALFQLACAETAATVLIHGASGGVGIAAIQMARRAGLRIMATAGTAGGLELIREEGADICLDHHSPDYRQAILEATSGKGVDVILEMLANVNLGHDLELLAEGGRVIVIGSRGPVEIVPRNLMSRNASIIGMLLWNTPPAALAAAIAEVNKRLVGGTIRPRVRAEIPLANAPEAHRLVMEPGAGGKIVLIP
ncbi:MAG TPA: NADPH:quinone reductase [Thermoanaerobaculia bacterium]|nr:NADPH:quinone reductase [Thermoanaerobaculia bacterium]